MKRLLFLAVLLPVAASAQFQGVIPVNSQTVDMTSFVTNAVDQLVNTYAGLFLALVNPWLRNGLLVSLFIAGCFWLFDSPVLGGKTLFRAMLTYAVIDFLLRYYTTPLPLIGVPFSQIFRLEGKYLAGVIDISLLNVFIQNVSDLFSHTDKPSPWNFFQAIAYYTVLLAMALPEIALFVETVTAIIALGIGALLGPLFLALYVFPFSWCRNLFWAWVHYMIKYALYRVFASALVFIWATAEMTLITQLFNGQYSLPTFTGLLLGILVFNVGCAISCFRIGRFVSDMTTGTAHGGGEVFGAVAAATATAGRFF